MRKSAMAFWGLFVMTAPALATPADWQTYDYPNFAFSIDFPAKPARIDKVLTDNGSIPTMQLDAPAGELAYSVTTANFAHRNDGPPPDAKRAAQEGMEGVFSVGAMHGLHSFKVAGGSGLEGIAVAEHETMRARLYYIAPYTWVLFASTSNRQDYQSLYRGDAKRFFDSFHPHVK